MVSTEPKTLYEKYGGHEGVGKVVEIFYNKVLSDPDVSPFFAETNMKKQKQHQTNFISFALGGPNKYDGRNMRDAHAHLNLTDKEFNIIADLLSKSLKEAGASDEDIASIIKVVASLHDEVLNL